MNNELNEKIIKILDKAIDKDRVLEVNYNDGGECLRRREMIHIKQALTPPNAEEIVKELKDLYEQNVRFENNKFYFRTTENKLYLIDISLALSTLTKRKLWTKAHKITSFFMEVK